MSGTDQILWLMVVFGAAMIVIGLWMGHHVDVLDRRIDEVEARQAAQKLHAAE